MARHKTALRLTVAIVVAAIVIGAAASVYVATNHGHSATKPPSGQAPAVPFIKVSGNRLLTRSGEPARLIGVNIGASQYYCLGKHTEPFPMPIDNASVSALLSWHINAVRLLVDDYCWLGIDGEPDAMTSAVDRKSIESFVSLLNASHIEVIITMTEQSGHSKVGGVKQKAAATLPPMAEEASALSFWSSVASTFVRAPGVIFDLFGEPQRIPWPCWENGCSIGGIKLAGMQQLVDTVRATGADQPMMLEGVDWSNDLSGWLAHEPTDPDHQLIASVAVYEQDSCVTNKCWNATIATTNKRVPVVTGELGDKTCSTHFISKYMKFADKHSLSYLAWAWFTGGGCTNGGTLLSSYAGTPTPYGAVYKQHLAELYADQKGATDLGPETN